MTQIPFCPIEEAIELFRQGNMIIIVDHKNRENEGDLVIAGEMADAKSINFMSRYGRGLICVSLYKERLKQLQLPPMVIHNTDPFQTAFSVSVDAKEGTTTGISAFDRAKTIAKLIDPKSKAEDFHRPGHIFPLSGQKKGVLERPGHTEASLDMCIQAQRYPCGVICEIMDDQGQMARLDYLESFSKKHQLKMISIQQIIEYRLKNENLIHPSVETKLSTPFGLFKMVAYENQLDSNIHLALVQGDIHHYESILVRIHSECITGDTFFSTRCDCGEQLRYSMQQIAKEKYGVIIYMRQEGRGIGLINKLKAYTLQDQGLDTVEANHKLGFTADLRDYTLAVKIIQNLGISKLRLLTNNPDKINIFKNYPSIMANRVPIITSPNNDNENYLSIKKAKLGHLL